METPLFHQIPYLSDMDEKNLRWGMIGCGNVTEKKSAPSFNKIPGSRLMAVGNRTPERAREYASAHGVPTWHRDPFEVIGNPEVDIVYVATPPGAHMKYALACLEAGKPVYLEKPMARTWEECRVINEAAAHAGVPVFVAYYRRALDYFNRVKQLLNEERLGRVLHVNMQQYFPARPEDYRKDQLPWRVIPGQSGGGYFHDLGCHALDILFYLFGDPVKAFGHPTNLAGLYDPEDTLTASLVLPGQLMVTASWSFITPEPYDKDLVEIIGEKGKVKFSVFSFKPITLVSDGKHQTISPVQPEHIQMPLITTIVGEMRGEGQCPSTGETAAVTSRVMDQIRAI